MTWSVEIAELSVFAQSYLQGCERSFPSVDEAVEYLHSFEDWEQPMLRLISNEHPELKLAVCGTRHEYTSDAVPF